ncbi:MAG: hypothetical protein Q4C01_05605 [Clostridia bacterium]|nr:hypothetical protein [Clostridia bacterium]
MKRLIIVPIIFILLIGCKAKTEEIPPKTEGYRDVCALALDTIIPALDKRLTELVGGYNETAQEPLSLTYYSFFDRYLPLTRELCEDERVLSALHESYSSYDGGASVMRTAENEYQMTLDTYEGEILLKCRYRPLDGAIQCVRYKNGEALDFFDFVPLENNRYAIANGTTMAILTYENGLVTEALYARMKYSYSADEEVYDSDIRRLNYPEDSFFAMESIDEGTILAREDDLMQLTEMDSEGLKIRLCIPQYLYDENHTFVKRDWVWQDELIINAE